MLLYVAGKYKGTGDGQLVTDDMDKTRNIHKAMTIAIQLWKDGHTVICPHLNTMDFEHYTNIPNREFARRDLLIVERCDGIVMVDNWRASRGAQLELAHALQNELEVYFWPDKPKTEK